MSVGVFLRACLNQLIYDVLSRDPPNLQMSTNKIPTDKQMDGRTLPSALSACYVVDNDVDIGVCTELI